MKYKLKIGIVLFLLLITSSIIMSLWFPLVSAELLNQKQLNNFTLIFTADNATGCNLTFIQYPDYRSTGFLNTPISKSGQTFTQNITGGNFSQLGTTCIWYTCTDPSATPTTASGNTCLNVTPNGSVINPVQISIYILFLIICLLVIYFSFKATNSNPFSADNIKQSKKYQDRKNNKFGFYLDLLKKKFWIVGVFGIYLGIFLFTAILNQLVFNLGLAELNLILIYFNDVMAWLAIPFVLFWIGYIIIYFYKGTEEILKYEFGVGASER